MENAIALVSLLVACQALLALLVIILRRSDPKE